MIIALHLLIYDPGAFSVSLNVFTQNFNENMVPPNMGQNNREWPSNVLASS